MNLITVNEKSINIDHITQFSYWDVKKRAAQNKSMLAIHLTDGRKVVLTGKVAECAFSYLKDKTESEEDMS